MHISAYQLICVKESDFDEQIAVLGLTISTIWKFYGKDRQPNGYYFWHPHGLKKNKQIFKNWIAAPVAALLLCDDEQLISH